VYILALALICWIVSGCLMVGYLGDLGRQVDADQEFWAESWNNASLINMERDRKLDQVDRRSSRTDVVANRAEAIAKSAQTAIHEHLDWVEEQRLANAKAAQKARRRPRGHQ
jgi:hypothetical protein